MEREIEETIRNLTAPLLYDFSKFVLETANGCKIKRVYFLARDGYEPYIFSHRIAKEFRIPVECRYLFASRLAWRLASYSLMPKEQTLDLIFAPSQDLTPALVFERIKASPSEYGLLMDGSEFEKDRILNRNELEKLRNRVENSNLFWKIVEKKSEEALENTLKYFEQEGLFEGPFAICDTGWAGTMQNCLELLLHERDVKYPVYGIYFGLYKCPKKTTGVNAYYFLPTKNFFRKAKFNNNLLESMFVSPHGMTQGYKELNGKIVPVLKQEKSEWFLQDHTILQSWLRENIEADIDNRAKIRKSLLRTMYKPKRENLICFQRYRFSDDPSESHRESLVKKLSKEEAAHFLFFKRLQTKLGKKGRKALPKVYWLYGSIEASDLKHKYWYRWNNLAWEMLRLAKIRIRNS